MKRKTIEIGERTFELLSAITEAELQELIQHDKSFSRCYQNPSDTKIAIYKDWMKWANNPYLCDPFGYLECETILVNSFNVFQFTLDIVLDDAFGNPYWLLHITKSHQTACKVL